jgi:hypothetical protein
MAILSLANGRAGRSPRPANTPLPLRALAGRQDGRAGHSPDPWILQPNDGFDLLQGLKPQLAARGTAASISHWFRAFTPLCDKNDRTFGLL